MQIQILIDTDKDDPSYTAHVLRAVISRHQSDPDEYIAAREAFEHAAEVGSLAEARAFAAAVSTPAAPAEPKASTPQASEPQAEARAAGVEPAKRGRGRPRKIVNEANAEPAVPIAPAEQSAQTAAVASDATPSAGTAGEASAAFAPPVGPSFNADGTPTGKVPEVDGPMTAEGVLEAVFNRDGPSGAIACLQRFGVMRLRELKLDQRDEFVAYCRDVLAGKVDQNGSQQ